jgi:uncharacterized integral membrane protein
MTNDAVKSILAIIAVLSVIVGFFMGLVPSEMFSAIIGGLITQFAQAGRITELSKQVVTQQAEIQSLKPHG